MVYPKGDATRCKKEFTPKFRAPDEICPHKKGFQGIENLLPANAKEQGYCQLWSI